MLTPPEAEVLSNEQLYKLFLKLERQEKKASGQDPYEDQKVLHGKFATFAWLGSTFYLYLSSDAASLFSLEAMLVACVGMFPAAVTFGLAGYLAQRLIAKAFLLILSDELGRVGRASIVMVGGALAACNVVLVYLMARWLFRLLGN